MITGNEEIGFVIWAYAGVALVTFLLIGSVWLKTVQTRARLARLEAQGIRRRSASTTTGTISA